MSKDQNEGDGQAPELGKKRTDWAEKRTDWAEDRTIMANERTFAGWMRTGLASMGVGLGFKALFGPFEPTWVPKLVANLFMLGAIVIFIAAYGAAAKLQDRLNSHVAVPASLWRMRLIASVFSLGAVTLGAVLWLI